MTAGERITNADGLALYVAKDLSALGAIANVVREREKASLAKFAELLAKRGFAPAGTSLPELG